MGISNGANNSSVECKLGGCKSNGNPDGSDNGLFKTPSKNATTKNVARSVECKLGGCESDGNPDGSDNGVLKGSADGINSADGLFKTPSNNATAKKVPKTGLRMTREMIEGSVSSAKILFSTKLTISPERTLHDCNLGDENRAYLGTAGTFAIFKRIDGKNNIAVFTNEAGERKFVSNIPSANEAHYHFFGNAGRQLTLVWDACHEETDQPRVRTYMFFFDHMWQYSLAMYNLLNRNENLVEEWFDPAGRFCPNEASLPPHPQIKPEDDMDIDDENKIKMRETPYAKKKLKDEDDEYDDYNDFDIVGPSQLW